MTVYATQAISADKVKLRWEEPYVSEALDFMMRLLPYGVYCGFEPSQAGTPNTTVVLKLSASRGGASIALCPTGPVAVTDPPYSLLLREAADVAVSVGTMLPNASGFSRQGYVVAVLTYTQGGATTAEYRVVDVAELIAIRGVAGVVVLASLSVPNGATTILNAHIVSSDSSAVWGTKDKERPFYVQPSFLTNPDQLNHDSPRVSFINPGHARELFAMRFWGMHEWYSGSFSGVSPGNTSVQPGTVTPAGGAEIDVPAGGIPPTAGRVNDDPSIQIGSYRGVIGKVARNPSGGAFRGSPQVQMAYDNVAFDAQQMPNTEENTHAGYLSRSHFFEPQNGRSAVTNVTFTNAVLLVAPNIVRVDLGTQPGLRFGNAGDTDLAPGDIIEIISDNSGSNAAAGNYVIMSIDPDGATGSGHAQLVLGALSAASPVKSASLAWATFAATTAVVRIWRVEFWSGRSGDVRNTNNVTPNLAQRSGTRIRTKANTALAGSSVGLSTVALKDSTSDELWAISYRAAYATRVRVTDYRGRTEQTAMSASLQHRPALHDTSSDATPLEIIIDPFTHGTSGGSNRVIDVDQGGEHFLEFSLAAAYVAEVRPKDGEEIVIWINIIDEFNTVNLAWDIEFVFDGGDDVLPVETGPAVFRFKGTAMFGKFYMERTDYYP